MIKYAIAAAMLAVSMMTQPIAALPIPGCGPGMGCMPGDPHKVVETAPTQLNTSLVVFTTLTTGQEKELKETASLIPMGPLPIPGGGPDNWCQWCTYIPLNGIICVPYPC
jgi:hypothetical protein